MAAARAAARAMRCGVGRNMMQTPLLLAGVGLSDFQGVEKENGAELGTRTPYPSNVNAVL